MVAGAKSTVSNAAPQPYLMYPVFEPPMRPSAISSERKAISPVLLIQQGQFAQTLIAGSPEKTAILSLTGQLEEEHLKTFDPESG